MSWQLSLSIAAALSVPCCALLLVVRPSLTGMSAAPVAAGDASLSSHRALLSSILSYLTSIRQSPHASSLLLSVDSLDAAVDCLSEATGLPRPPSAATATASTDSSQQQQQQPLLADIYQAGLAALSASSSSSAAHFSQFVSLLTARGFFSGLEPGSAAYSERLTAARQKYDDKYGVPAAAAAASPASSSSSGVSDSDKQRAEQLKAEGNSFLSSQQYDSAVKRYTAAIQLNPHSAIYYGNRAAAHINLSQWREAEKDCRDAIAIDPHYGKVREHTHTLTLTPHTGCILKADSSRSVVPSGSSRT